MKFLLIFFFVAEIILGSKLDLIQESSELIGLVIFKNFSDSSKSFCVFSSVKDHVIISKIFLLTNNFYFYFSAPEYQVFLRFELFCKSKGILGIFSNPYNRAISSKISSLIFISLLHEGGVTTNFHFH